MQNLGPLIIVPTLLIIYGIYLAIAAFFSDFVYLFTGSRSSSKIKIKEMTSLKTRIYTSLTGVAWIVVACFLTIMVTQGQIFHLLTQFLLSHH